MMAHSWRFGSSGIRALMGGAEHELNAASIALIARATAAVLREDNPGGGDIAVCYDSRENSALFARTAAAAFTAAGFCVYLSPAPTPFLAFAVRRLRAKAGVSITASHNPRQYNGYKLYGPDGAQAGADLCRRVEERIRILSAAGAANSAGGHTAFAAAHKPIPPAVEEDYLRLVIAHTGAAGIRPEAVSAAYTPLGGAAGRLMRRLADSLSLPLAFVTAEMEPDSGFCGIARPAPDQAAAFARAIAAGRAAGAELLLANDPDGDRFGLMARQGGEYRLLTGNETGLLLLQYLILSARAAGRDIAGKFVITSLVSSPLAETVCARHGIALHYTPIGFRHMARLIAGDAAGFLFAFEESGGYLATAQLRDKDGLSAALLMLSAAGFYREQGLSLAQALDALYRQYGRCYDLSAALPCPAQRAAELLAAWRSRPPERLGGIAVRQFTDYLQQPQEPRADILRLDLAGERRLYIRQSGTEDRLKLYMFGPDIAACERLRQAAGQTLGLTSTDLADIKI